jgi:hypothetical protein
MNLLPAFAFLLAPLLAFPRASTAVCTGDPEGCGEPPIQWKSIAFRAKTGEAISLDYIAPPFVAESVERTTDAWLTVSLLGDGDCHDPRFSGGTIDVSLVGKNHDLVIDREQVTLKYDAVPMSPLCHFTGLLDGPIVRVFDPDAGFVTPRYVMIVVPHVAGYPETPLSDSSGVPNFTFELEVATDSAPR